MPSSRLHADPRFFGRIRGAVETKLTQKSATEFEASAFEGQVVATGATELSAARALEPEIRNFLASGATKAPLNVNDVNGRKFEGR